MSEGQVVKNDMQSASSIIGLFKPLGYLCWVMRNRGGKGNKYDDIATMLLCRLIAHVSPAFAYMYTMWHYHDIVSIVTRMAHGKNNYM